jgi:zinc transport system permease protein
MLTTWLKEAIDAVTALAPAGTFLSYSFNVRGMLAVLVVSLICGAVGSLVVGNRMAFFSDALAHCAFAGVALGLLLGLAAGAAKEDEFYQWIPLIMAAFGILVGLAIAYVRDTTALASDTVIGVFFAGAIGFGAALFKLLNRQGYFTPENFLFGEPITVSEQDLLLLAGLALVTLGLLAWMYNQFVFASFNVSLARSRQIPVRLCNYLFIVLLALIVNLCLRTVGVLLINALLVVPAATASNLSRNLRQMFWLTIGLCMAVGVLGQLLSWEVGIHSDVQLGIGGTIVVLSVLVFFASMLLGPRLRGRQGV